MAVRRKAARRGVQEEPARSADVQHTPSVVQPAWLPSVAIYALLVFLFIYAVVFAAARDVSLGAVRRSTAPPDLALALRELATLQDVRPHVFPGVAAVPRWRPSDLAHLNLTRCYTGANARFGPYHDEQRPMARLPQVGPRHGYTETAMLASDFFGDARPAGVHAYYSGEIERDLTTRALREELLPLERALVSLWPQRSSVVSPAGIRADAVVRASV